MPVQVQASNVARSTRQYLLFENGRHTSAGPPSINPPLFFHLLFYHHKMASPLLRMYDMIQSFNQFPSPSGPTAPSSSNREVNHLDRPVPLHPPVLDRQFPPVDCLDTGDEASDEELA